MVIVETDALKSLFYLLLQSAWYKILYSTILYCTSVSQKNLLVIVIYNVGWKNSNESLLQLLKIVKFQINCTIVRHTQYGLVAMLRARSFLTRYANADD